MNSINLHNASQKPKHSLLFTVHRHLCDLPTPNYRHQSHAPMNKISLKAVLTYWCTRVENFSYLPFLKTIAVSIHSSTFQGTFMHAKHMEQQLERVVTLPGALSV